MITAVFNGSAYARATGLWQYDYGQILRIQGLSLPKAIRIDFSLSEIGSESVSRVGITKDGITDVPIPDSMLENGDTTMDYDIYAFVYLEDETSGKTTHRITMPVTSRPKPQAFDAPEDAQLFRDAIAAVNESAGRAEAAEKLAEAWAHGHKDYPEREEDNSKYYAGVAEEKAGAANDAMEQATKSAAEALQYEQAAKSSETAAQEAQAGAEAAEGKAELHALDAAASASEAELAKTQALEKIDEIKSDIAAEAKRAKEAEDNRIKKFYTGNLGEVSVQDSDDGAVRNLVIGGRCEQRTTNGYNLLPNHAVDSEINGVTFTVNPDGSITANGTATYFADQYIYGKNNDNGEYITLEKGYYASHGSMCPQNNNAYIVFFRTVEFGAITTQTVITKLQESDMHIYGVFYRIVTDATAENWTIYPMIERGTIAHDYEAYTGGAPSPSPDYPQEIKCVDGCSMTLANAEGTETQTAAIPFTLQGIGDVRDELYVYADGAGKLVQWYPTVLDPAKTVAVQALTEPIETALTAEQVKALFDLRTYYGGTNITYESNNGVEPVVNFDYACAVENFVAYIKAAQGDDRKFIYDMDERMTDSEYVAALAYVNAEYAAALTELEV